MKYDLAKLMKQNLDKINKLKTSAASKKFEKHHELTMYEHDWHLINLSEIPGLNLNFQKCQYTDAENWDYILLFDLGCEFYLIFEKYNDEIYDEKPIIVFNDNNFEGLNNYKGRRKEIVYSPIFNETNKSQVLRIYSVITSSRKGRTALPLSAAGRTGENPLQFITSFPLPNYSPHMDGCKIKEIYAAQHSAHESVAEEDPVKEKSEPQNINSSVLPIDTDDALDRDLEEIKPKKRWTGKYKE